jgi:hypothetical protein
MTRAAVVVYRDLLRATRKVFTSDIKLLTHSRLHLRANFDVRGLSRQGIVVPPPSCTPRAAAIARLYGPSVHGPRHRHHITAERKKGVRLRVQVQRLAAPEAVCCGWLADDSRDGAMRRDLASSQGWRRRRRWRRGARLRTSSATTWYRG